MKKFLFLAIVCSSFIGCQSPRSTYMDGFVLWFSGSAVGIGFGEYVEIAPGGKFCRSATNDVAAVIGNERNYSSSTVDIDNLMATNILKQVGNSVSQDSDCPCRGR